MNDLEGPSTYLGLSWISLMEHFVKIVSGSQPFIFWQKVSFVDASLDTDQ